MIERAINLVYQCSRCEQSYASDALAFEHTCFTHPLSLDKIQRRKIEEADKEKKFCVYSLPTHALHWIKGCDKLPINEKWDFCPKCGKPTKGFDPMFSEKKSDMEEANRAFKDAEG